jgi:hypothetical protein
METTEDVSKEIRLDLDYLWNPVERIYDIVIAIFEIPVDCGLLKVFCQWILLPAWNKLSNIKL